MGEYLQTFTVPANDSIVAGVPCGGIAGVYADGTLTISWDYNGVEGELVTAQVWEPFGGFHPALTSQLKFTNNTAAAIKVSVRCL